MLTLGIDVSKLTLDCYLSEGIEKKARHSCQFQTSNSEAGFEELAEFLKTKKMGIEQMTVVLEPTSQYHKALLYWPCCCFVDAGNLRDKAFYKKLPSTCILWCHTKGISIRHIGARTIANDETRSSSSSGRTTNGSHGNCVF